MGESMATDERDSLAVLCNDPERRAEAAAVAGQLGVHLLLNIEPDRLDDPAFVVLCDRHGLSLQQTGRKAPGPVRVDFASGAVDHRRKFGGGKGQMIARAVGVKAGVYPAVLDATAGLGRDAFVLASLGCRVRMLERSPVVHALLADGLARGRQTAEEADRELWEILERMTLLPVDGQVYLDSLADALRPDVIYLDPMFPERQKSADVKKEMRAFHTLVGSDEDAPGLLSAALARARYRVVVKRPRKAPFVDERSPSYQLEGKSSRYDIYTLHKLPEKLPPASAINDQKRLGNS
jgi:16S rRNA (guanine1516-N2)-methyltransferase